MTLDARALKTANALLNKFGKRLTLRSAAADGVYDPATGEVVTQVIEADFMGFIESPQGTDLQDGSVLATDRIVLIKASDLSAYPIPNDRIVIDGVAHTVKSVSETWSGNQIVLFRAVVAK